MEHEVSEACSQEPITKSYTSQTNSIYIVTPYSFFPLMHATSLTHLTLLDFITLIFGEVGKL
jgi:hypothetical protein